MTPMPEIAIIDPNTLSSIGLQNLIQDLIPQAVIRSFRSFAAFSQDTPDMYFHYFVASGIFFEHTAFFLERKQKTIVLTISENLPQLSAMRTLHICQDEQHLAKSILQLHHRGHPREVSQAYPQRDELEIQSGREQAPPPTHRSSTWSQEDHSRDLSAREVEVITLIAKGLINKEIADKLHISLTTVISHRKNITEKLGIKSVSGLTIYAVMHGYIEVDEI